MVFGLACVNLNLLTLFVYVRIWALVFYELGHTLGCSCTDNIVIRVFPINANTNLIGRKAPQSLQFGKGDEPSPTVTTAFRNTNQSWQMQAVDKWYISLISSARHRKLDISNSFYIKMSREYTMPLPLSDNLRYSITMPQSETSWVRMFWILLTMILHFDSSCTVNI